MFDLSYALKSGYTVKITGENPERFLNAAAAKGIFISGAVREPGGLRARISKNALALMEKDMPDGLELEVLRSHGPARALGRYKGRSMLFVGLPLMLLVVFASTRFVWRVEINGGEPGLRRQVEEFVTKNGVRPGARIKDIDRTAISRKAILTFDELMWLWIDIRGTVARVNIAERDLPPEIASKEPANVIAAETGVVERLTVTGGAAAVSEGQSVEKGSLLISAVVESERVDPMLRHAGGEVIARVWREKNILIPKLTEKRTRTGASRVIRAIKIKKFIVNFSLNSSILYPKYDRIKKSYRLGNIPVEFISCKYMEVDAEYVPTDIEKQKSDFRRTFEEELASGGAEIVSINESQSDAGDYVEYSLTAECLTDIGKTVPIE